MRLETKKAIDYHAGRPLLAILQLAAWVLGSVLHRNHDVEPVRSILITKFQGIGSLIIAKPALAELRRQRPDVRIVFWGSISMKVLADQMPEFDEVLLFDDRNLISACRSLAGTLPRIWRMRLDWAIDFEVYSRLSSALITLSCARNRTGFALEHIRSRRVHTHLVYFNRYRHLAEAYARIVGLLLPSGDTVDVTNYGIWRFELSPLPSITDRYFVFNVHAGDLSLERRWPKASFKALIQDLLRLRPDAVACLIGHGPAEVAYCADFCEDSRIRNLSGALSLKETIQLIANAELVVTNDTAALHLALSTGAPLVGLFGPTRAETFVPSSGARVATAQIPLYCSPCVHHWEPAPCHGDNQCMKRLTVSHVRSLCCEVLGIPAPSGSIEEPDASDFYPGLVYKRPQG
ncbi:MAG: glycosyltransferase family 9 protein [Methylococcales bacterium]